LADVLAVHPVRREIVLVQTTTADHLAHRKAKVKAVAELPGLLAAGCKVQLHGWKRQGTSWRVKIVNIRAKDLEAVIVCPLPARRRGGRRFQQGSLFGSAQASTSADTPLARSERGTSGPKRLQRDSHEQS
jgi:hypothetical protein